MQQKEKNALRYHSYGRPGKIEVIPTKPLSTPEEFALAYSSGAIVSAKGINSNHWNAYKYTNKGNLVAVISNGSNIYGMDNNGALASKPLLEGQSMLFKLYADIDAFDIEIAEKDCDKLIEIIQSMAPTFGAINIVGIEAPLCYQIEKRLSSILGIPVIYDCRCGKAICVAAAIINATEFACKEINNLTIVLSNNEEAITDILLEIGVKSDNIIILDNKDNSSLPSAIMDADAYIGLSEDNRITEELLPSMAHDPIILLLTETSLGIEYEKVKKIRPDAIYATCSAENFSQTNDTIAFPYIFRGALDTLATSINHKMLLAAAKSIAQLAHRPAPSSLQKRYNRTLSFGREYFLPLPNDRRLTTEVPVAVARAAIDSGVARYNIKDWDNYCYTLISRLEREYHFHREIFGCHLNSKRLRRKFSRTMPSIVL